MSHWCHWKKLSWKDEWGIKQPLLHLCLPACPPICNDVEDVTGHIVYPRWKTVPSYCLSSVFIVRPHRFQVSFMTILHSVLYSLFFEKLHLFRLLLKSESSSWFITFSIFFNVILLDIVHAVAKVTIFIFVHHCATCYFRCISSFLLRIWKGRKKLFVLTSASAATASQTFML